MLELEESIAQLKVVHVAGTKGKVTAVCVETASDGFSYVVSCTITIHDGSCYGVITISVTSARSNLFFFSSNTCESCVSLYIKKKEGPEPLQHTPCASNLFLFGLCFPMEHWSQHFTVLDLGIKRKRRGHRRNHVSLISGRPG